MCQTKHIEMNLNFDGLCSCSVLPDHWRYAPITVITVHMFKNVSKCGCVGSCSEYIIMVRLWVRRARNSLITSQVRQQCAVTSRVVHYDNHVTVARVVSLVTAKVTVEVLHKIKNL